MENKIPLEPAHYYHIYNHANGFDDFFRNRNDYQKFLDGYVEYIVPICETFAYCFMPNHFHFFVQIKPESELIETLKTIQGTKKVYSESISYRFSHFFNSYAQSYNKKYKRQGSLFRSSFKRKPVEDKEYFVDLVHYIHSNPVNAGFAKNIEQWEFSSYNLILSESATFLNKPSVIEHFGNIDNFIQVHQSIFKDPSSD
jgi:REP element-mobilizing transposase RayT